MSNFLELSALRLDQPLGSFFVVSIRAQDLLEISFSEELQYRDEVGNVKGTQRKLNVPRLKEIARYIDSVEMAFPNSIILAANYDGLEGRLIEEPSEMWRFESDGFGNTGKLIIPKKKRLAAIIDGQHRLRAFDFVSKQERKDIDLVCSVYFDLPNSYQAFLFATINANQKKVDKSLALEQFGFNVGDEPESSWTPEKLAVFLSRKLNIDKQSPFYQHIKVAPKDDNKLFSTPVNTTWSISTATIVEGILGLISSNPKRDRVEMQQATIFKGRSRKMIKEFRDSSPLRIHFIEIKDQTIYDTVLAYFGVAKELFWTSPSKETYIVKTVGIQALFDILKMILLHARAEFPEQVDFRNFLLPSASVSFSDKFFQASGIGRSRIRNLIGLAAGLIGWEKVKIKDVYAYKNILADVQSDESGEKWIWEDEAENAIETLLKTARWHPSDGAVELNLGNTEDDYVPFNNSNQFYDKILTIAVERVSSFMPLDAEATKFSETDVRKILNSCLVEYADKLKALGWGQLLS